MSVCFCFPTFPPHNNKSRSQFLFKLFFFKKKRSKKRPTLVLAKKKFLSHCFVQYHTKPVNEVVVRLQCRVLCMISRFNKKGLHSLTLTLATSFPSRLFFDFFFFVCFFLKHKTRKRSRCPLTVSCSLHLTKKQQKNKNKNKTSEKKRLPKTQPPHKTRKTKSLSVLQCRVLCMVDKLKFSREEKRKRRNKTKNPQESIHENRITL